MGGAGAGTFDRFCPYRLIGTDPQHEGGNAGTKAG